MATPSILSSPKREPLLSLNSANRPANLRQTSLLDVFAKHAIQAQQPSSEATSGDSQDINLHSSDEEEVLEPSRKRARLSNALEEARPVLPPREASFSQSGRRLTNHAAKPDALLSSFGLMTRLSLSAPHKLGRRGVQNQRRDMTDYIESFVSNNASDVYRCDSISDHRHWAPPFACAFTNAAKAGGKQMLATATEEGVVSLIDTTKTAEEERTTTRTSFQAHNNAIFDIRWSANDRYLATASGDQSLCVFDAETQQEVAKACGHLSTIKQVVWDPQQGDGSSVLATGSRDGSVRIWDLRSRDGKDGDDENMNQTRLDITIDQVNLIQNAHGLKAKSGKGLKSSRTAVRSVTSIVYLQQRDHLIASAGSADGIVKVWDLRKSHSRRINPVPIASSPDHSLVTPINAPPRSHGISTLSLSPDGTSLYAMSTSHAIYQLDARNLSAASPLKTFTAPTLPHASFRTSSFYTKLALSPSGHPYGGGRFLTAGSQDGSVWMWDTEESTGQKAVALNGHAKETEVTAMDWSSEGFSTCSDDLTIRLWRSDIRTKRLAEEDTTEARHLKWRNSGIWPCTD